MKKTLTRSLALALVICMALALAAPALAASSTMIVTANTQVRSAPNQQNNNIIGSLLRNDIVVRTGTTGLWSIIEFGGGTGYVLSNKLRTYSGHVPGNIVSGQYDYSSGAPAKAPTSSSVRSTVYTTGAANVRSGPGTNYSKLGQLSKGTAVQKIGTTGNWTLIEWNSGVAYVSTSLLSGYSSGSSSSVGSVSGGTVRAKQNVNIRSGPGTNYSIIGWLAQGETVTRIGSSGNWTQVSYNGGTGYVSSTYLTSTSSGSSSSSSTSSDTLLAARTYTAVYTGPGSNNTILGYLSAGQTVTYLGANGAYYRIQYGSHSYAYVYGANMRWVSSSSSTGSSGNYSYASGYVYAQTTTRVYDMASTSGRSLGYLYAGDGAQRTGVYGSFTQINFGGITGYVLTSNVTTSSSYNSWNMSSIQSWMYSRYSGANCYTTPNETSSYYHGRLSLNERVWAVEGNSTWTKIQVNGYTLYTRTSNLAYDYSYNSGYPYPGGSYWNPGYWNNIGYVYNTATAYTDSSLTTPVYVANTTTPAQVLANSSVTLLNYYPGNQIAQISYYYNNVQYTGWISVNAANLRVY